MAKAGGMERGGTGMNCQRGADGSGISGLRRRKIDIPAILPAAENYFTPAFG